ncbi:3-methyladenine DNA glycosylase [Nocardioides sp. CFH 31398]|uniref:3-methyladenine DNA glycosylase n=1 Tax=Nocardioides sp. CFH 31398 TaxID=2919579 RepID=UPI001F066F86|nr:3-methyladenine DNA glycosylase [Nocardioides sp. CFH 31398]MCH1867353.1 3-methyladenine DNA glycosylase [Nocardioides sp. CFH 31398]
MLAAPPLVVLDEAEVAERTAMHEARWERLVGPYAERRARGEKHPVHDFLFTYYAERPGRLRRWHPGYGVALPPGVPHAGWRGYTTDAASGRVAVSADFLAERRLLVETLHRLLRATQRRPAHTRCFGLHEWAMVHGQADGDVRHALPLRLGAAGTDRVVEGHRIACSHFDAFRFFTDTARPLNTLRPASDDRPDFEQPGCLHAGMDLYKHAYRLSPLVDSDLVLDCFELAADVRVLDMRASPYDLTGVPGVDTTPVRIETAAGKREYAAAQATFAERAAPLRARVADACELLLGLA